MLDTFESRLRSEWLAAFCEPRSFQEAGFDPKSLANLSAKDAGNFMRAVDGRLVVHQSGVFTAPCSRAKEQIFWTGETVITPRPLTLWLEPVITIGALARLHEDFSWEPGRLGLQSKTWAFDLVGYAEDSQTELLMCEVKKSEREIDKLIELMTKHLATPAEADPELKGAEQNAFRKVVALRTSPSSQVFWALGPNHYEFIFRIRRDGVGKLSLEPADESALAMQSFVSTPKANF